MVSEASEFVAEAFFVELVSASVVVSVTELKCSSVSAVELAAAPELIKFVAVDYSFDVSCVHVKIFEAVFFLIVEISFKLLLRDDLRVSIRMF